MADFEFVEAHEAEPQKKDDYVAILHRYLDEFISKDALRKDVEFCFQQGRVIGAYRNKKLIGAVVGVYTPFFGKFHIAHLAVEKEYQDKGIGSELVESVIPEEESASVHLNEDNPGIERFYRKLDFKPTHTRFKRSAGKDSEVKPSD